MRIKLTRFVSAQASLGFPYGIVYREYLMDGSVWAIVPFNWVYRWARQLWHILRSPKNKSLEERKARWVSDVIRIVGRYKVNHEIPLDHIHDKRTLVLITLLGVEERIKEEYEEYIDG